MKGDLKCLRTYNSFVIPICESSDVVGRRAACS